MTVTVTDFRTREQWAAAFRAAALIGDYSKTEIMLAWSLAQNFHCQKRKCDPGYEKLAKQTGAAERTLKDAAKRLEADGWCIRKRGGRDEHTNFTLTIPSGISADIAALMEDQKPASISAENELHKCGYARTSKDRGSTEKSAAPPRAPLSVESQSEPIRTRAPDGADLRYLLQEAREAYALSQTQAEPLRTIISDALSIMPKSFVATHITASPSCQAFLASIASAKMELTANSS